MGGSSRGKWPDVGARLDKYSVIPRISIAKTMSEFEIVRFDDDTKKILRTVCKHRGEDISSFIRRVAKTELAKLSYLTPDEKKSLGVPPPASLPQGVPQRKQTR